MIQFDATQRGPLHDVRVVDLSRLVAGNMLTAYLADFGADVIKIERDDPPGQPGKGGDDLRHWREAGQPIYWKVYGRNKRSLVLDIKSDAGRAHLKKLLRHSQILVENFVPGGLEKMGLAPALLHALNPALVIVRISGWGQTGPYSHKPGFGTLVEAMSGFAYLNGFPDKPPALPPLAMADMIAGVYGAAGVLTALRVAEREGRGQVIDLSLFEPIFSFIASEAAKTTLTGEATMRAGNQSTHAAPRNVYACSDGGHVALSGSMQAMAMRILDTIDREMDKAAHEEADTALPQEAGTEAHKEVAMEARKEAATAPALEPGRAPGRARFRDDPRFATNDTRVANRAALDAVIGGFIGARSTPENLALFEAAQVTVGPVCSMKELLGHPYTMGREVIVEVEDADMGSLPMHNMVPRLSGSPGGFRRAAPKLGEHTDEILAELARLP